jgi:hypothetical protein
MSNTDRPERFPIFCTGLLWLKRVITFFVFLRPRDTTPKNTFQVQGLGEYFDALHTRNTSLTTNHTFPIQEWCSFQHPLVNNVCG